MMASKRSRLGRSALAIISMVLVVVIAAASVGHMPSTEEEARDYPEVIKDKTQQMHDNAAEIAREAREGAESWTVWAKDKISEGLGFKDSLDATAKKTNDKIHNVASDAGQYGTDKARDAKDTASEKASETMRSAKDKAYDTAQAAKDKAYETAHKAGEAMLGAKEKVYEAAGAAKDASFDAAERAEEAVDGAKDKGRDATVKAKEKTEEAKKKAGETLDSAKDGARYVKDRNVNDRDPIYRVEEL